MQAADRGVSFSIVIPAYNVGSVVPAQLDALAEQVSKTSSELIVVDDCSSDETSGAVRDWALSHLSVPLTLVRTPRRGGPNLSRNIGTRVARGRYLLLVDGDDVVRPGWFDALASAIEASNRAVVVSGVADFPDGRVGVRPATYQGQDTAFGGNMGVHRSLVIESGGFDENLRRGGTETEWLMRVQSMPGHRVLICPSAHILYREHPDDGGPLGSCRRAASRARGHAYLALRLQRSRLQGSRTHLIASAIVLAGKSMVRSVIELVGRQRPGGLSTAAGGLSYLTWIVVYSLHLPAPRRSGLLSQSSGEVTWTSRTALSSSTAKS